MDRVQSLASAALHLLAHELIMWWSAASMMLSLRLVLQAHHPAAGSIWQPHCVEAGQPPAARRPVQRGSRERPCHHHC